MDKGNRSKRTMITLEVKKQIVSMHESGVRVRDLARRLGLPRTTISSILKNKEAIKGANVAKGVKMLTRKRTQTIEEMEKRLLIWITEKQLAGDSISSGLICEKALRLHADLIKNAPGASAEGENFKASRGWFENFKRRSGIHSAVRPGEAVSDHKLDADRFDLEFKDYVEVEGFLPQQNSPIAEDIVSLVVGSDDMEELMEDPKTEITTEELHDILMEEEEDKEEKEEKEEIRESVSTAMIQEICAKWTDVQTFVEKYRPDEAAVSHATNSFNDNVMSQFRQILKCRGKQTSVEDDLMRKRSSESESGISGAKKSREGMAGEESPAVILEKDHRTPEQKAPLLIIEGDPSIQATIIIIAGSGSAPPWQQLRESQKGCSLCCVISPASSAPCGLCYFLGDVKIASGQPLQVPITFEEVAVFFTEEEWALLDPGQRALHKEVMEQNYGMLASLSKDALFP